MKIKQIEVKNYRLLKDFTLDLEDELSLVIGKNNCGKTSLLLALNKFLNSGKFKSDDINLDYKKQLTTFMLSSFPNETDYIKDGIYLRLYIEYNDTDNLSNINELMMDLDELNNQIILNFELVLTYEKLLQMKSDFDAIVGFTGSNEEKIKYFFKNELLKYFTYSEKSISLNKQKEVIDFIDLKKENIKLDKVINYKYISAKREVSNKDINNTLSSQTSRIYDKNESTPEQKEAIDKFKIELLKTDKQLDVNYKDIFKDIVEKVSKFGGMKADDSIISIHSSLQHQDLLKGNTTVMYSQDGDSLPEHYNGLGYMNLISMIFEIETLLIEFKKSLEEKPADINLLFIEEPEAHTHPQMQYIFIKNIKSLLEDGIKRADGNNRKLQYIITTHSSHIVSESDFNDIKYLKKQNKNSVISKNLKDLKKEYVENGEEENYRFLKQYLTLNRAELFFTDKAILIEGDTERILIPAMMKKIDEESLITDKKLLSQNVSIVEVGAYSQIFEKFIDFIGVKTLIITDIDSVNNTGNACEVFSSSATNTSNSSLKYFFDKSSLSDYINRSLDNKILIKNNTTKKWEINKDDGFLLIVYQTKEINADAINYNGRSFEDSFFHINKQFMYENLTKFSIGIKNPRYINSIHKDYQDSPYLWADECINKKPSFAMEILRNSKEENGKSFVNWNIPSYIKEGLIWLRDN
ncbi:ATP-dependent nuclease [Aliarcobacter butzleri]|uniref:ATP-dependent nuclease n=1 Tax=Aliarcobacter butzleri TaxID=28197 RepID=UPI0021B5D8FC|nr:ATP-dependent endonuclease [Aliarcobacter butzleri]MCT7587750.1 ATP-dependent endonuclease [Aliarcobacter butzleri]